MSSEEVRERERTDTDKWGLKSERRACAVCGETSADKWPRGVSERKEKGVRWRGRSVGSAVRFEEGEGGGGLA